MTRGHQVALLLTALLAAAIVGTHRAAPPAKPTTVAAGCTTSRALWHQLGTAVHHLASGSTNHAPAPSAS